MNVYNVLNMGSAKTVQKFLEQSERKPVIADAAKVIPELIRCKGIIHYTRSGIRTVVTSGDLTIEEGDFLVVATQCTTGKVQTIPVTFIPTDYAFIMGNSNDDFYNAAGRFMNRRPKTTVIDTCRSLESCLRMLKTGDTITTPIKNVVIVSHARGEGMLYFKVNDADEDDRIYLDELCTYVNSSDRCTISPRVIKNEAATTICIRGCNIGNEPRFLSFLKTLFGGNVTVIAPKHFDCFYFFSFGEDINVRYEFMQYGFTMYTKEHVTTKQNLVGMFQRKGFVDIDGNPIRQASLNSWIPTSIHTGSIRTPFTCTNPIHTQAGQYITREYRYNSRQIFAPGQTAISYAHGAVVPASRESRITALKELLGNDPRMQNNYPSATCNIPFYNRFGYRSIDDLVDNLDWTITWNAKSRKMSYSAKRYEYQLRIPITDTGNNLLCNVLPATGERKYTCNDIKESDTRLFTRV